MMIRKIFSRFQINKKLRPAYDSFNIDKHLELFPDLLKVMPEGSESYNEAKYLELNPDVALAVKNGQFAIGWDHYVHYGRNENRQITSSGAAPLPPVKLILYVGAKGPSDFIRVGREFTNYLLDFCGLQPENSILDVGCGCGRIAIPLTDQLSKNGRYCGFDIDKDCITWLQNNISHNHSNFAFIHADIYHHLYNPKGKCLSEEFTFPFENDSFDIIYLASVFTHMLPGEMEHYLSEISRVLKKGGKCLITYFLINEDSLRLIKNNESTLGINHKEENYWTSNPNSPGESVGYEEAQLRKLYNRFGLKIFSIFYGSWCGRNNFLSYQDIIIAGKSG
jgi:ubiquinone/menaquinone biosynthesis C-methylase UbiE